MRAEIRQQPSLLQQIVMETRPKPTELDLKIQETIAQLKLIELAALFQMEKEDFKGCFQSLTVSQVVTLALVKIVGEYFQRSDKKITGGVCAYLFSDKGKEMAYFSALAASWEIPRNVQEQYTSSLQAACALTKLSQILQRKIQEVYPPPSQDRGKILKTIERIQGIWQRFLPLLNEEVQASYAKIKTEGSKAQEIFRDLWVPPSLDPYKESFIRSFKIGLDAFLRNSLQEARYVFLQRQVISCAVARCFHGKVGSKIPEVLEEVCVLFTRQMAAAIYFFRPLAHFFQTLQTPSKSSKPIDIQEYINALKDWICKGLGLSLNGPPPKLSYGPQIEGIVRQALQNYERDYEEEDKRLRERFNLRDGRSTKKSIQDLEQMFSKLIYPQLQDCPVQKWQDRRALYKTVAMLFEEQSKMLPDLLVIDEKRMEEMTRCSLSEKSLETGIPLDALTEAVNSQTAFLENMYTLLQAYRHQVAGFPFFAEAESSLKALA